jgi:hypothetical protein
MKVGVLTEEMCHDNRKEAGRPWRFQEVHHAYNDDHYDHHAKQRVEQDDDEQNLPGRQW